MYLITRYILFLFFIGINVYANASDSLTHKSSDSALLDYIIESGIPLSHNNSVEIIHSGKDKFRLLFEDIRKAEKHVHLEYFNFRNDSIGKELFIVLSERAAAGVKIRILCDYFGNCSNTLPVKKHNIEAMKAIGIDFVYYDPIKFPYINHVFHRDHRKIAVIDGKIGYIGGMNVADYYINGNDVVGEWFDKHMRVKGTAVSHLQDIFIYSWNEVTNEGIGGPSFYTGQPDSVNKTVAIVVHAPQIKPKEIKALYVKSINQAQNKIQIVNPYFLPSSIVRKALKKALKRNVKIEILISEKSDIKFTPDGSFHIAYKLMKKGADVYIYKGGFHHSKIMMVDSSFCTVGSTNLDVRSLRYDAEVNAFIFDKGTTKELVDRFELDKTKSYLLTREHRPNLWRRFVGSLADLLTPLL